MDEPTTTCGPWRIARIDREAFLQPAADGAVGEVAARFAVAGIIEPHAGAALSLGPAVERLRLGALHVGLEAAEPEQAWALIGSCPRARARRWSAPAEAIRLSGMSGELRSCALWPIGMKESRSLLAASRPERKGDAVMIPAASAALARRRHDPAAGAGAARRSGRPRRGRYRAHAAAIGRPRHRRRRRRAAGRRTARLRRRMAADAERHVQSAAHPRQCAAAGEPDRRRAHRYRACASAGAAWSALAATAPHAGVPGHVVSRPAAGDSWPARVSTARWRAATA